MLKNADLTNKNKKQTVPNGLNSMFTTKEQQFKIL
jgi:hypothetical protein